LLDYAPLHDFIIARGGMWKMKISWNDRYGCAA